jgi:hypothetical protein
MTQTDILNLLIFLLRLVAMGLVSNICLKVLNFILNVKIDL